MNKRRINLAGDFSGRQLLGRMIRQELTPPVDNRAKILDLMKGLEKASQTGSWYVPSRLSVDFTADDYLEVMKEGYRYARQFKDNWFQGVNACPYGPASPMRKNHKAEAWYAGWWFYFYVVNKWEKAADAAESKE